MSDYKMTEQHLRGEIVEYLNENGTAFSPFMSTALLCLLAGIVGYSFSDDMINDLSQFIPTEEEIKKYK